MLRIAAAAVLALLASPAIACELVSRDGFKLELPEPMTVIFVDPEGARTTCNSVGMGTGVMVRGLDCGDGIQGTIFFSPATLDGPENGPSIVVAQNTVFFEKCGK